MKTLGIVVFIVFFDLSIKTENLSNVLLYSRNNQTPIDTEVNNIVFDMDSNLYHTVRIGSQIWLSENLKTTKYNDGSIIPNIQNATTWINSATPAYCWYENDELSYKKDYGALYNWYLVNTNKICPVGWHVPNNDEWMKLAIFLGGELIAGGKLKEDSTYHWQPPNFSATNVTGFTALPGGIRYYRGQFTGMGEFSFWWSSSQIDSMHADNRYIISRSSMFDRDYCNKSLGLYIRCIKD